MSVCRHGIQAEYCWYCTKECVSLTNKEQKMSNNPEPPSAEVLNRQIIQHNKELLIEIEILKRKNSCLVNEINLADERLREAKNRTFATFNNEECWIYQGDGSDDLKSLVCPVVISASKLIKLGLK